MDIHIDTEINYDFLQYSWVSVVYKLKEMVANNMGKLGDYLASQCGNPHGVIGLSLIHI